MHIIHATHLDVRELGAHRANHDHHVERERQREEGEREEGVLVAARQAEALEGEEDVGDNVDQSESDLQQEADNETQGMSTCDRKQRWARVRVQPGITKATVGR